MNLAVPLRGLAWAAALASAAAAHAGSSRFDAPAPPAYQRECASCHVAYPPALLPAASWARVMSNLRQHHGTDASLEPAQVTEISTWLAQNASRRLAADAAPEDRVTRTAWFVREHRKVPQSTWARASIKTPANCTACHTGAAQGDFNEHAIRIPR